jgi:orotate phosphoribosyltransferase-like protein
VVADLEELSTRDPGRSMRSLAQEMNISRSTVRPLVPDERTQKIVSKFSLIWSGTFIADLDPGS